MTGVEGRERAAGWSAAARAEQIRAEARGGVLRRFLARLGVDGRAKAGEAVAARWDAGAVGEEMTAKLLQGLALEGWGGFYDRALPTGRANFDHVLVPPSGDRVVLVDSKLWSARRGPVVKSAGGGLEHGGQDRSRAVSTLLWEARVLGAELRKHGVRVRVVSVMCVHGAPVPAGREYVDGVTVVEGRRLVLQLREWVSGVPADGERFARVTGVCSRVLPRYMEDGARS